MTNFEKAKKPLAELVDIAQSIVDGKEPVIDGARKMVSLIGQTPYPNDEIFRPIKGFDSETDSYPVGKVRDNYAPEFIAHLDAEMEKYLEEVGGSIINVCNNIIRKYKDRFNPRLCPVCGYSGLHAPPYNKFGCASFEICPCCGVEFGYQDATRSHLDLRDEWLAAGAPWQSTVTKPPENWSAQQQLQRALLLS